MSFFVEDHEGLYGEVSLIRNPNIEYVCHCECGGIGTRSQYGRDEVCPDCGKELDWNKEERWSECI